MPRADGITLHLESATKGAAPAEFELRMGDVRKGAASPASAPSVPAEPAPLEEEPKIVLGPSDCRLTWQGQTLMKADACDDQSASQFGHARTVRTNHTNFYFYAEMPIPLRDFVHVGGAGPRRSSETDGVASSNLRCLKP